MSRLLAPWLTLALALAGWAAPLRAQHAIFAGKLVRGTLSFDATATLGPFTGTTSAVTGAMTAAADVRDVRGWVEFESPTLKTGNGLRDHDMMKSLDADSLKQMRFEVLGVSLGAEAGDSATLTLSGQLTLHGVTRDVAVPVTAHFGSSEIRVAGSFRLNVRDYGVTRLSRMLGAFKMNPDITVRLDVVFAPASGT